MIRLLAFALCGVLLGASTTAWAYEGYRAGGGDRGCADCHPSFEGIGTLHTLHVGPNAITNTCNLCHVTIGDSPSTMTSGAVNGQGCRGCHGTDNGTSSDWAAGLREHHLQAGAPADLNGEFCADCHIDPAPDPESTLPVYYTRSDVNVKDPCDSMTGDGEDRDGDGEGLDNDGDLTYDESDSDCSATGVEDMALVPRTAQIMAITPNPMSLGSCEIVFGVPEATEVRLLVFDMAGRMLLYRKLGTLPTGWHRSVFDGRGDSGRPLANGIYLIRLETGQGVDVKRVTVLRARRP